MGNYLYSNNNNTNIESLSKSCVEYNHDNDTYLVFSSGGIKGIAYCGALNHFKCKNIKGYAGTSAGSIYAGLLAVGYTSEELTSIMMESDFNYLLDGKTSYLRQGINLYSKFGEVPGDNFCKFIGDLIEIKTGNPDYTIDELYKKQNIELIIVSTNLSLSQEAHFSPHSHNEDYRNIPIRQAIRMSMSISFIFEPVLYKDHYYVDGGLLNSFPYELFKDKKNSTTIGFLLIGKSDNELLCDKGLDIKCFTDFASAHITTIYISNLRTMLQKYNNTNNIIKIVTPDYPMGFFDLNKEQKIELLEIGKKAVDHL
jgi:predicted acylesterase/phospholipase RssA